MIKYNSAGKPVERVLYREGDTSLDNRVFTRFKYDNSSRLTWITVIDSSENYGFMSDSLKVSYDAQNRISGLVNYHPSQVGISYCTYSYVGDTTKIQYSNITDPMGGSIEHDITLIYNSQGNISKMIRVWYDQQQFGDTLTDTVTYHEYDNKPNVYAATNLSSFPATLVKAGSIGLHLPGEVIIPVPLPKNNPVKYTMVSSITSLPPREVSYQYTYDGRGQVKIEEATIESSQYTRVTTYEYGK